jgi:alpha-tubulin suppressor-like RCC1 family protein
LPTLVTELTPLSVISIHPCADACAVLTLDGLIYTVGDGDEGKLGHQDIVHEKLKHWRQVEALARSKVSAGEGRVVTMASGRTSMAAITENGHLYTWGSSQYGQLGHQDYSVKKAPKKNSALREMEMSISSASCGQDHMLLLTPDNEIFSVGAGYRGQLGNGSLDNKWTPQILNPTKLHEGCMTAGAVRGPLGNDIAQVCAGSAHSVAVTNKGTVYTWGHGASGQLGHPKPPPDPTKPSFMQPRFQLLFPGLLTSLVSKVNVTRAVAGDNHTVLLALDGSVYAFGDNSFGQCGVVDDGTPSVDDPRCIDSLSDIASIAAGSNHTLVLSKSGDCYAFGSNNRGQLGLDSTLEKVTTPTKIGGLVALGYITANYDVSFGICKETMEKRKKEARKRPAPPPEPVGSSAPSSVKAPPSKKAKGKK